MGELKNQIVYYPVFEDNDTLTSHYYRACWYLPHENNLCEYVFLFKKKECVLQKKPDYMGGSNVPVNHIMIEERLENYGKCLSESKVVLLWKKIADCELNRLKTGGNIVLDVTTGDESSKEWGVYCGIIWKYFKSKDEKNILIAQSRDKLIRIGNRIKASGVKTGCVFGTGPSLETADEFSFTGCVCVACNSIVQNKRLLAHINPVFITAGDVISHLGVSLYAEKFRRDLTEYLKESGAYFFTTAMFGYLLLEQCAEIADRIILAEQLADEPNYDLYERYALPKLDSTFNIHMLPLIHTFCDDIFILGCDGKSQDRNNEDFWAHAQKAQYHSLVDTGHLCHPGFASYREKNTYERYQNSVRISIEEGEARHGKRYYTLKPSYVEALKGREIDPGRLKFQYDEDNRLLVSKLCGNRLNNKNGAEE